MGTDMITAKEARKLSEANTGMTLYALLQRVEAKVKEATAKGETSCYMELPSIGWGITRELKEKLITAGYQVSIGSKQGDKPQLSLTW